MNFPVSTAQQLHAVLRALRRARGLSQAELGARLGVNQKRVARIEGAPGVTSYDQIARMISALGGRLVVEDQPGFTSDKNQKAQKGPKENW